MLDDPEGFDPREVSLSQFLTAVTEWMGETGHEAFKIKARTGDTGEMRRFAIVDLDMAEAALVKREGHLN